MTRLDHHLTLEGVLLRDADLSGQHAGGISLTASILHAVELSGSALEQLSLSDVELSGCNLSNVAVPQARWHRVHARNCRMTGMLISGDVLSDVVFTDCRIDLASFHSSRPDRLRGLSMPWPEIVAHSRVWAAALGIVALDD